MSTLPTTAFTYVACDIPEGMTVREWRLAADAASHRRPRRRRFLHRHRRPRATHR